MNRVLGFLGSVLALMLGMFSPAFAVIDVSTATTAITDAGTAAGVIGLAVLVMLIGVKAWHWIRRGA
jgi:hypothetical protein